MHIAAWDFLHHICPSTSLHDVPRNKEKISLQLKIENGNQPKGISIQSELRGMLFPCRKIGRAHSENVTKQGNTPGPMIPAARGTTLLASLSSACISKWSWLRFAFGAVILSKRKVSISTQKKLTMVLSSKEFDSITDGQSNPILLHALRLLVPELIATKLLHLIPNQLMKSAVTPFMMKRTASLSRVQIVQEIEI